MKYLINIMYDGTNFYGFQRLKGKRSVQEVIEDALSIINKSKVEIKGAGRTDRGVHAYGQKASFSLDVNIPLDRMIDAINSLLPNDVRVSDVKVVSDDFHARFNVKKKEYIYKINNGFNDPLMINYYHHVNKKLDINKMRRAAKLFLGVHHFDNFVSGERINSEAIVYDIKIYKKKDIIYIKFIGKSFYRYMVRNMVGAILDYEKGNTTLKEIKDMLDNYSISKTLSCAPACGLYLMNIWY